MSQRNKRRLASIGVSLVFLLIIASYVVSLISPNTTSTSTDTIDDVAQINTPVPTRIIPPTPDRSGTPLVMGEPVVQSNGLFQAAVPTDWVVQRNDYDFSIPRARITFASASRLSIIEMLLQVGVNYPSHQALSDDFFTNSYFFAAWADYDGFAETNRTVGDTVVVDFDLSAEGVDYLGRQIAWLDGDWLHMIRMIVPQNNPPLLEELTQKTTAAFISYEDQRGSDYNFFGFADPVLGYLFRHPGWKQVSGDVGSPVIFEDVTTNSRLLVRFFEEVSLENLEAAEAFVTDTYRQNVDVLSSQVITRQFGDGFMASYADVDNESNSISGLIVVLNGANGVVVADLRLPQGNVDLLSTNAATSFDRLLAVMRSFMPLPPADYVNVPVENPAAPIEAVEATPVPEDEEVNEEATESVTEETTEEATADATEEATESEVEETATPEPEG